MQQAVKSKYTGRTTMAGSKIKEKDILGEKKSLHCCENVQIWQKIMPKWTRLHIKITGQFHLTRLNSDTTREKINSTSFAFFTFKIKS